MSLKDIKIPPGLALFGGLVLLLVLGDKFLPKMDHVEKQVWNCTRSQISLTHSDGNYSYLLKIKPGTQGGSYRGTMNNKYEKGSESGTWKLGRSMKGAPHLYLRPKYGENSKISLDWECARQAGFGL